MQVRHPMPYQDDREYGWGHGTHRHAPTPIATDSCNTFISKDNYGVNCEGYKDTWP